MADEETSSKPACLRRGSDELGEAAGAGGPRGEPGGCGDLRRDLYHGAGVGAAVDMRSSI